jgi:hypothetical protein
MLIVSIFILEDDRASENKIDSYFNKQVKAA